MLVVSYGGGTNSTAMLVGMKNKSITPNAILFADTGSENPHTYQHIEIMQKWCARNGFPEITIVKHRNKLGEIYTLEEDCIKRKALPSVAYGFKTCSQRYKVRPQEKWLKHWPPAIKHFNEGGKITKAIGFDADEPQRALIDYTDANFDYWYPLIEWDWGRDECIETIISEGLPRAGKSSCFFCPNSKPSEVRRLAKNHPELLDRAISIEKNAELTNIKGLGRQYSWQSVIATDDMFDFPTQDIPCGCYDGGN